MCGLQYRSVTCRPQKDFHTMSDVAVKELGDEAPTDQGTSKLGDSGTLLGTMVVLLLSTQSSIPEGHVGTATATPESPCETGTNKKKHLVSSIP